MNIIKKLSDILSGGSDSSTGSGGKAEEELNRFVDKMEIEVKKAKIDVAEAIALKNVFEKKYTDTCNSVEKNIHYSELALQRGEAGLAAQALKKVEESKVKKEEYKKELEVQGKVENDLKALLLSLEERLETTKTQRDLLLTRSRGVEARKQINTAGHQLKGLESEKVFENLEEQVDRMEAEANAIEELDRLQSKPDR